MREINEKLIRVSKLMYSIREDLKITGREYQLRVLGEITEKVSELRLSVLRDIRQDSTPSEDIKNEVTNALIEVVEATHRPIKEVIEEARVVYDVEKEKVISKEDYYNMFKGW